MADPTSSSFIPKRSGTINRPAPRRSNIFIFSIISYSLFVAAPIGSAVVFIYDMYVGKQLNQAIVNLDAEIKTFSDADMERVSEFDERLTIANELLDSHVSIASVFSILEASAASTIQFDSLDITRTDRNTLTVAADMSSDAFDALLFQRTIFANTSNISSTTYADVAYQGETEETAVNAPNSNGDGEEPAIPPKRLTLTGQFVFTADAILYTPQQTVQTETFETFESQEGATSTSDDGEPVVGDAGNSNDI